MDSRTQRWMSVTEDTLDEDARERFETALQGTLFTDLFKLSREACSELVRQRASAILAQRLQGPPEEPQAAEDSEVSFVEADCPTELPANLATHRHFYKYPANGRWVLTTRSGVQVATFASEALLDAWWKGLKKQRGRILTRTRKEAPLRTE